MSIFSGFHKGRQQEPEKKKNFPKKEKVKTAPVKKKTSVKTAVTKPASALKGFGEAKPASALKGFGEAKAKGQEKTTASLTGRIKKTGRPAMIFTFPHLSEKATELEEEGKYVFRVDPRSNKIEIKKAFEEMHRVKVISVNIINIPRKKRIWRGQPGYRPGYKKAIIQVAKGQKANIH
jgi:large subunit ribosomal protein L23